MGVTMELHGVRELIAQLTRVESGMSGAAMLPTLTAAAMPIEATWKRLAPVRTGSYRRSIHVSPGETGPTSAKVYIGTDIVTPPYPWFLEMGTSRMSARPSARPAFDREAPQALRIIEHGLGQRIDRVVAR